MQLGSEHGGGTRPPQLPLHFPAPNDCGVNHVPTVRRMNVLCSDCEENNLSEGDLWMDRSRIGHPLAKYGTVIPPSHKNPSTKTLVRVYLSHGLQLPQCQC